MSNLDPHTVSSFGDEWVRFDQSAMPDEELHKRFDEYFAIFPWATLPNDAEGFDMGCGSGRWSGLAAARVGRLHCIDPSDAIDVARRNLAGVPNIEFHRAGVGDPVLARGSQDFGYALGVLHHVPDTTAAIRSCADLLKPGAPLLLYLYYAFDNRPWWYRMVWKVSDVVRRISSRLPGPIKNAVADVIAVLVYLPLVWLARLLERTGRDVSRLPLSYYRRYGFYTMRTDARDRFGTPLEQRFTRAQITRMMADAGLADVVFSPAAPYWCAVGRKTGVAAAVTP